MFIRYLNKYFSLSRPSQSSFAQEFTSIHPSQGGRLPCFTFKKMGKYHIQENQKSEFPIKIERKSRNKYKFKQILTSCLQQVEIISRIQLSNQQHAMPNCLSQSPNHKPYTNKHRQTDTNKTNKNQTTPKYKHSPTQTSHRKQNKGTGALQNPKANTSSSEREQRVRVEQVYGTIMISNYTI